MSARDFTFRNKDNDFSVVLLSNDKKTERVTTEHSVRSNFKSFLPVDLDLTNGLWEMAVDRVILPNRQNNALKLKISPLFGTKEIKEIDFTPGVYDDTYQVLDELLILGENTELDLEFNKENYGQDEFLVGEFSRSSKKIRKLHLTFPISFGIEIFKKIHNREVTTLFDVWIVIELCSSLYGTHVYNSFFYNYPIYEYDGNIETNPEIVFKTNSTTIQNFIKQTGIMSSNRGPNNRHLSMEFFSKDPSKMPHGYFPYLWVSENLANALKLDEYSSFYHANQDIIRLNNPNGKAGFLLIHKSKPETKLLSGYDVRILDGKGVEKINKKKKLLDVKLKGDEIIMKSNFKIEFVNRNGKVTFTNPVEMKFKKTNIRQHLLVDVSKLVEKDVSAVNLYLPSIYSTKPIFLKSGIEQHLFEVNIHLKKGTETILHQTRRERQYYPVRQSRDKFIEVLLKETQTGLVPKFWYGFTLIVLHFRKAKRNWFEKF